MRNLIESLLLLSILFVFRWVATHRIRQWNIRSTDLRRKWMVQVRNWTFLLFVGGLVIIWASELKTIALSITAIAVALVLATKELLLCVAGSSLKASTQAFHLGDRISIHGIRGDVIDQNLIGTKLLEIGPSPNGLLYTGNVVTIPNSLFLQAPLKNETLSPQICMHTFDVVLSREIDKHWPEAEAILLEAAERVCKNYLVEAKGAMDKLAKHTALEPPSVEPRSSVEYLPFKDIKITLRVACLSNNRWKIQQAILKRFKRKFFQDSDPTSALTVNQ